LFITHTHLDHVAGFERLFVSSYFDEARRGRVRLYVPAPVVPLLHQRVGDYPNALAEGGVNFWDAFQVIPVGGSFWHDGVRLEVFPTRHHWPETAFGLRFTAAWCGPATPGRSPKCSRATPMPPNSSRMTARSTAIPHTAASRTWNANIPQHCFRGACFTITATARKAKSSPHAAIALPIPGNWSH